ncbi:hypothetical protein [Trichocoleus sp. FACHB-262]|uniref:hypothetical protein n=1 Tax=Trichocoleus sp. FACHB-262 TaxID=2692869 RepID=UPI0016830E56|nr:hypothetical protein [Trichocoleus sp. FACHB-262]MBD2122512.1 hypothetical protein [Trichocoleus sp. FACHB-262]
MPVLTSHKKAIAPASTKRGERSSTEILAHATANPNGTSSVPLRDRPQLLTFIIHDLGRATLSRDCLCPTHCSVAL